MEGQEAQARPVPAPVEDFAPANQDDSDTPDPLADDTHPIDPFNDGGGKPGVVETLARKSKRFFEELATVGNIGGNGGGPLVDAEEMQARREREQHDEEAAAEFEQARAERQREYDESMHKIGTHSFSGKELMEMKSWLDNDENCELFENALMKKMGISKEEAKRKTAEAKRLLELEEKKRNGNLTHEEERELREGKEKPGMGDTLDTINKMASSSGRKLELTQAGIVAESDVIKNSVRSSISEVSASSSAVNDAEMEKIRALLQLKDAERVGTLTAQGRAQLNQYQESPKIKAEVDAVTATFVTSNEKLSASSSVMASSARNDLPATRNLKSEFSAAGQGLPAAVPSAPANVASVKTSFNASELSL